MKIEIDLTTAPVWLLWVLVVLIGANCILGIINRSMRIKLKRMSLKAQSTKEEP